MNARIEYTNRERIGLWAVAVVGITGLNVAFLYGLFVNRAALSSALTNPVSVAFIAESLLLVVVLAYLLNKWRVARLRWIWFVLLSLLGSIAFALPVVLLWPGPVDRSP